MLHEPAAQAGEDYSVRYKTRLGVTMFIPYLLFYAGFVAWNLASPESMEAIVLLGMNLATVYGFALIVVALILALIYDAMCRAREALDKAASDAAKSASATTTEGAGERKAT
jgi:uncharacterized membrane protein (DUF485 family)